MIKILVCICYLSFAVTSVSTKLNCLKLKSVCVGNKACRKQFSYLKTSCHFYEAKCFAKDERRPQCKDSSNRVLANFEGISICDCLEVAKSSKKQKCREIFNMLFANPCLSSVQHKIIIETTSDIPAASTMKSTIASIIISNPTEETEDSSINVPLNEATAASNETDSNSNRRIKPAHSTHYTLIILFLILFLTLILVIGFIIFKIKTGNFNMLSFQKRKKDRKTLENKLSSLNTKSGDLATETDCNRELMSEETQG